MTPEEAAQANFTQPAVERDSEFELASEAAIGLREALTDPVKKLGYGLAVQVVYLSENMQRQLQVSAWPLGKKGSLKHPSHIQALVQKFVPGETYQHHRVQISMAEPEIFERQSFELSPAYHLGENVIPLVKEGKL